MLMTVAPRSAAVRTAMAKVLTSPTPVAPPSGANLLLDCRIARIAASGATPLNPELGAPPAIPATIVPWPSQSAVPSPRAT